MTDERMPQMTGTELLRRSQGECPEAIRIVFTGYADIKSVVDAINQGQIYRYLTKPWDPDELVDMLHQACDHHDRIAERRRLLVDLRDYVSRTQSTPPASGSQDAEQLTRSGAELPARL